MQGGLTPHRGRRAPQRGAPQTAVGGLELLDLLGVPPDQIVGVGPQAGDVVDAPYGDARARQGVQVLGRLGGRRLPVGQRSRLGAEHRPHGVEDLVVELGVVQACHEVIVPLPRGVVRQKVPGDTLRGRRRRVHTGGDADTVQRGAELRAQGIDYEDLTPIFAHVAETVYTRDIYGRD